jgi:hypothetical protein
MMSFRLRARRLALTLLVLSAALLSGCENVALIGRPTLESPDPLRRVTATVEGVDHQLREIYLRTERDQHYVVNYLAGTQVTAQGRDYPVTDLKRGDRIEVELREGADKRLYADQVRLFTSGGSTSAATGIRSVEGTVERVSLERGVIELRARNGERLTIYVPESASQETKDRFHRVWPGDSLRLEGEVLSENRLELLAFL